MMSQSAVDMKKEKKTAASSLFKKNVKKFMNNKLALLGLLVIVIMTVACIIGAIAGVDYVTPHLQNHVRTVIDRHIVRNIVDQRALLPHLIKHLF